MLYKVDLHTHSTASPDGSLSAKHYKRMLSTKRLDCVAVTDHNTIKMALELHKELGDSIIVGEEVTTKDGEIIGLFLKEVVPAGMSAAETAQAIHAQGGLVYVPHPFETVRKGLTLEALQIIATDVDIIETHNGRAIFQNRTSQALIWSIAHSVPGAASSDAHGQAGWGKTFTSLAAMPTRDTLIKLLDEADFKRSFPGVRGMLYPKFNRLRGGKKG